MVYESLKQKEEFNYSKFMMWRCITVMAHADGIVDKAESDYLLNIFSNMHKTGIINKDALETLENDLSNEQNVFDLLKNINDPNYRAQVIYFARLLAYKDGELNPSEDLMLKKLHIEITKDQDLVKIKKDIQDNIQKELVLHETDKDSRRPTKGLYGLIDQLALHFDIDLMDE